MEPIPDAAPDRSLPPIRSSALQVGVRATARAATVHASEAYDPKVIKPTPPPARVEETTLGALAARMKRAPVDENEFDPSVYLRRTAVRAPRPTGAGLAAAALKRLGKR